MEKFRFLVPTRKALDEAEAIIARAPEVESPANMMERAALLAVIRRHLALKLFLKRLTQNACSCSNKEAIWIMENDYAAFTFRRLAEIAQTLRQKEMASESQESGNDQS